MSSATADTYTTPQDADVADDPNDYRALHTGAIVGIVASVVALFFPFVVASAANLMAVAPLAGLPIISLAISFWAMRSIQANREFFTGLGPSIVGVALSLIALIGGLGYGGYVYATEVPDGYVRTSFLEIKPSDEDFEQSQPIPAAIQELGGKKVFIKGYMRPDSTKSRVNIKDFLLVRDNQECCFGDASQVQFFDQMRVNLGPGLTTSLTPHVYRIGGKLTWRPGRQQLGEPPLVYEIDADYIQ